MKKNQSFPSLSGKIILAGNPNVGKSTLFNHLTGMKTHTGNWAGKTVSVSEGYGVHNSKHYLIQDLPGITSLSNPDAEEKAAFNAIIKGDYDCAVIVADATNLSRSLCLALRILELKSNCVLCVNLTDEAKKQGILIDCEKLSFILGIPVVPCSATHKKGISPLLDECEKICSGKEYSPFFPLYDTATEDFIQSMPYDRKEAIIKLHSAHHLPPMHIRNAMSLKISETSEKIAHLVTNEQKHTHHRLTLDKALCSPLFAIPIMFIFLALILFITISGANFPSSMLSYLFEKGGIYLERFLSAIQFSPFIKGLLTEGIYRTTTTVIAVMLPPMAIFFPLFTLLEDSGFLPRIAFNSDPVFKKCGTSGKQALCICMGLGCNCVGISNSAIIPSEKQRLISILTNSITPCNGRFGAIITAISLICVSKVTSAFSLFLVLLFSFLLSLTVSFILSKTILPTKKEGLILELTPFRRPRFSQVIISSVWDKTLHITLRAVSVAAPTGAVIYILNYFNLLTPFAAFLDPIGNIMGLDGIVLLAFILSFPANETVLPIAMMLYTSSAQIRDFSSIMLSETLIANGWDLSFVISFIIFSLCHWPCATALFTVKNETKSIKWTLLSVLIPLLTGFILTITANFIFSAISV